MHYEKSAGVIYVCTRTNHSYTIITLLLNVKSLGFLQDMYDTYLLRHDGTLGVQLLMVLKMFYYL